MFTKPRSHLLMSTLSLIIFSLLLSLQPLLTNTQADDSQPIVRLATYWDSAGHRAEISPDERHLIITNDNYTSFIEINTGRIVLSEPDGTSIRFTPTGNHVIVFQRDIRLIKIINLNDMMTILELEADGYGFSPLDNYLIVRHDQPQTTEFIDLLTMSVVLELDGYPRFASRPNSEDIVMVSTIDEATKAPATQVYAFPSGELLGEFLGEWGEISPNSTFISTVTVSPEPDSATLRVFDITTGDIVFVREYVKSHHYNSYSVGTHFVGDLVVVYHSESIPAISDVYELDTWELRFTVEGSIRFNEDYQFAVSNNDSGISDVSLIDVETGEIIDTVLGGMYFIDNDLLYRNQAINNDFNHIQLIDLSNMEVLAEVFGQNIGVALYNNILRVVQFNYSYETKIRFTDIITGELLFETINYARILDTNNDLAIMEDNGLEVLSNWRTGEMFIRTRYNTIEASPSENYFLVSNGQYIDLYGTSDMRVDTMPAPRPDYGFGELEAGDFQAYSNPEYLGTAIEYSSLNPTMFEVLGQSEDGGWVYTLFRWYDQNNPANGGYRQGWIPAEQLTVVHSWEDVPILTPNLELFQLRNYAEEAQATQVQ